MALMKRLLQERKGFSLIEVMIAVVLLAVGLLAFAGLEIIAVRNMTHSKDYGKANTYAQQKIEEIKALDWTSVTDGTDTLESSRYTRTWTVTTEGDMKTVSVTVSWVDPSQGAKTLTFYTDLYSNPSI
jgi:type IV pilus modification protein PilV